MKKITKKNISKELLECCDFDVKLQQYVSKEGKYLLKAIELQFKGENKNDKPFLKEDILLQPTKDTFKFEGINDFKYICELTAKPLLISKDQTEKSNEKIIAKNFESTESKRIFDESAGVVYVITFPWDNKEYFIKIGQTRTSFKSRLGSYNCGVLSNWRTASTTNIKILQSMVATRGIFKLYICESNDEKVYKWYNETSKSFATSKSLAYEDILVNKFIEQYKNKPLANIQTNSTKIKYKNK